MLTDVVETVTSETDGAIDPRALGNFLHLEITALSRLAQVNRNTLTRNPASFKVQEALKPVVEILSIAANLTGSPGRAVAWFLHQPLLDFDFRTPRELVAEGHAEAVKAHLRMLSDGVYS
ncbi:MAG: hypothetical protein VCD66_11120 [Alphaproteobacteria bacterium]|jgi:uncharacterized protein (DUF2384 family)